MPSAELVRRADQAIARLKFPAGMEEFIDGPKWVRAILLGEKYKEPDPDFISRKLALETMMGASIDDVFAQNNIQKVQDLIPNDPGAESEPFEITDLYVAASDYETGNPCFVIVEATYLESGEETKFTTGATNVQAILIGLLMNNAWPIRCKFKRGDSKDKGGRYLLFLMPPD